MTISETMEVLAVDVISAVTGVLMRQGGIYASFDILSTVANRSIGSNSTLAELVAVGSELLQQQPWVHKYLPVPARDVIMAWVDQVCDDLGDRKVIVRRGLLV